MQYTTCCMGKQVFKSQGEVKTFGIKSVGESLNFTTQWLSLKGLIG